MTQTADQIAQWAERQDEKKPTGAAAHLSPEQKHQIRVAYLATGGNVTYTEMGQRCASLIGRVVNRDTVAACLKGQEYAELRKHFDSEIKASAVEQLKAGVPGAAAAWVRSVDVAADKGDHKPAKDLLMHTGTIEPLDDDGRGRGPLVLVYVGDGQGPIGATPTPEDGIARPLAANGRRLTQDEADALSAKHAMTIQIGVSPDDVSVVVGAPPAGEDAMPERARP